MSTQWTFQSRGDQTVWDDAFKNWDDTQATWDSLETSFSEENKESF